MESQMNYAGGESRKSSSTIQVLQVHKTCSLGDLGDDYLEEGINVCHAHLGQALQQIGYNNKQIDAVIVNPECSISDIVSICVVATKKNVPLILHTEKFEWKAKEIALESGVDEYHVGALDQAFIRRIKLIKHVKSLKNPNPGRLQLRQQPDGSQVVKLWFLKRTFDITISIFLMLLLVPTLLLILPLLLFEGRGPVLCSSKRVGKNYKIFNLYKFRCLPSTTGQFLREAHLEGLPQVLNVLAGDLSLVGNCPIPVEDAEKLTKDRIAWRFLAPAGIVGLWRFNHAEENEMNPIDRANAEVEYALTQTVWLDIRILCGHFLNLTTSRKKKETEWVLQHH